MPDHFLRAAQAAAMLTPDLFGGPDAILGAVCASALKVNARLLETGAGQFADRVYALLVQSITDPRAAEAIAAQSGATLTPGRLLPALDLRQRLALAKLLLAVPAQCQGRGGVAHPIGIRRPASRHAAESLQEPRPARAASPVA